MDKTKTDAILDHLKRYKRITSWEAIELYKATRLSAIIFNLKERGYEIVTQIVTDNRGTRWGVYRYLGSTHGKAYK